MWMDTLKKLMGESKENIKKYEKLWIKIRDLIRSITKNSDDYDGKYMKTKFNLHDSLPLNKQYKFRLIVTIVVRAVFNENNKCYAQVFREECLYKMEK